jgi:hypothetical protein
MLVVALLVATALGLRLPGVPWGIVHGDLLEPDEVRYAEIASCLVTGLPPSPPDGRPCRHWQARAFGTQVGVVAAGASRFGLEFTRLHLVLVGRLLSVTYGILLVWLLYLFGRHVLGDRRAGVLAALLLAGSDLHATYSHYAVPEASHAFWFVASILLMIRYLRGDARLVTRLLLGVGIGMSLSTRLDPVPLLTLALLLPWYSPAPRRERIRDVVVIALFAAGSFALSWGSLDVGSYLSSFRATKARNFDVIKDDHHLLYNPLLYLAAVTAGTSIPMVVSAALGLVRLLKDRRHHRALKAVVTLSASIFFLLYWAGDSTHVRRASVFVPLCAILAGFFLSQVWSRGRLARLAAAGVVAYTTLLSALSQYQFVNDTRYRAQAYLDGAFGHSPEVAIAYSRYSDPAVRHFPNKASMTEPVTLDPSAYQRIGLVVLHETFYGRYAKFFATPFRTPRSCDQVYHCDPVAMPITQDILFGRSPFVLIRSVDVTHPLPERVLFKRLFGTFETFLGDVRIYARPDRLPPPSPGR